MTYDMLGLLMFVWYAGLRWTLFADQSKYPWAYAPINMITAFSSIPFLIWAIFLIDSSFNKYMYALSIFLMFRNIYYTIEDIIDFKSTPSKQQAFFILIDIMMWVFVGWWILKYKQFGGF